jgi:iron complex transport system substrate-binding protein
LSTGATTERTDPHRRRARWALAVVVAVVALGLASCSEVGLHAEAPPDAPRPAGADGGRTCVGPATAEAPPAVEPIAHDPPAQLPVTYTDSTGKAVTIADTSRVLALDSYGTLGSTVYALGLGDRLVGRDVSTGIPALADLPLVTHNGHELNGEAILDLAPTLVITDYSIGPLEVQLQLVDAGIPVVVLSDQRSRALISPQIEAVARGRRHRARRARRRATPRRPRRGRPPRGRGPHRRAGSEGAGRSPADGVPLRPRQRRRLLLVRGGLGCR